MTNKNPPPVVIPFNYDNFQKLAKEVAELKALSLSLAAQLEKAQTKKD